MTIMTEPQKISAFTAVKSFIRHPAHHLGKIYRKHFGGDESLHWCRVVMEAETEKLVHKLDISHMSVLEISGDKWKKENFGSYRSIFYPELDICSDVLEERFDLIIAEQVFEHILWPYRAVKNVYEMLNPGGYFLITTPFLLKVHRSPVDCSRWTDVGIKYLLAEGGFPLENIQADSWGNKRALIANLDRWTPYRKGRHALNNEADFPLVVWALAKKPIN